ncbi:MAG: pepsin/retropepsin-like aspartic protease family protein [Planctomycetota bacterium]
MGVLAAACGLFGRHGTARSPAPLLQATQQALRAGDVLTMESLLARARQRFPTDCAVLSYDALLADMRWHDDIALADLRGVAQHTLDASALAEASGRVGDKLFTLGSWAECVPHLRAGAGPTAEPTLRVRRQAWADLATVLPPVRRDPLSVDVRLPFEPASVPELMTLLGLGHGAFVLDTGATFTTLSESLASTLHVDALVPIGEVHDGAGRPFPAAFGRIPDLVLGGLRLGAKPVLVVRDQTLSMRDLFGGPSRGVDGLLGLDVIVRFRLVIDPKERTVAISTPTGSVAGSTAPCLRVDGGLRVPVQVEGKSLWFQLDTGASHTSLTAAGIAQLPGGAARAVPGYRAVHAPGGERISVRELQNLQVRVSGASFSDVTLPVIDRPTGASGFPLHGVLGADLVLRCRTTLESGLLLLEVL